MQQVTRAQQVAGQGKLYIDPVEQEAAAFAPATVANLGPGFDWMGCAVEVRGLGEWVCLWNQAQGSRCAGVIGIGRAAAAEKL